jgi:N-acyl-D-amino-acid deacylase
MRLEEGIRRITNLPAKTYGLKDRGLLQKGAYADIVVFDPTQLRDKATYQEPALMPVGIKYVLINGQMAAKQGVSESGRFGSFI